MVTCDTDMDMSVANTYVHILANPVRLISALVLTSHLECHKIFLILRTLLDHAFKQPQAVFVKHLHIYLIWLFMGTAVFK